MDLWLFLDMIVNKDWKPNFYKYEKIRRSGRYNMIMEAKQAIKTCGISSQEYRDIIPNYSAYKRYVKAQYGTVDKFMREFKE